MESEQPYYDDEDYGGRVLWGRVAFFGITLLLAFFLGRCTSDGVPPQELELAQDQNDQLQEQLDSLEAELEEARSDDETDGDGDGGEGEDAADGEGAGSDDSEPTSSDGSAPSGAQSERTHVVERGETLSELADQYYGDGDKHHLITEANGIDEDNPLQVGQELVIPPDPDA